MSTKRNSHFDCPDWAVGWPGEYDLANHGSGYRWVNPNRENRTKEEWPYSYSDHYLVGKARKGDIAVYSDRLQQWDRVSFARAWDRTGSYVGSLRRASDFMTTYYNRPIEVSAIAEGCNTSNGYPYWIIWFRDQRPRSISTEDKS